MIIIKPTNKGLREHAEKALNVFNSYKNKEIIEARGEDIPFVVEQFVEKKLNAFGLTGEDLFKEYLLENNNSKLKAVKKIMWYDKKALFNKPTLCLLGPSNKNLNLTPKKLKVCINVKYKNIVKKYINSLEAKGFGFEKIYLNGQTECSIGKISDLAIDIVYSGSTIKKLGISIYDKIFSSDFVIIGGKND